MLIYTIQKSSSSSRAREVCRISSLGEVRQINRRDDSDSVYYSGNANRGKSQFVSLGVEIQRKQLVTLQVKKM